MKPEDKSRHMKRQQFKNRIWLWVMLSNDEKRDGSEGMGKPTLVAQRSHNLHRPPLNLTRSEEWALRNVTTTWLTDARNIQVTLLSSPCQ